MKNKNLNFSIVCVSVFLVILIFCAGCSQKIKTHGKVRYSDGTPLTKGNVFLSNGLQMFQGTINQDGSFYLGEIRDGDGIPVGNYSAWISGANTTEYELDQKGERTGKQKDIIIIDPKYTDRETSGLNFEIKPGQKNDLEIIVEKPNK
jgi:hypothetical protein